MVESKMLESKIEGEKVGNATNISLPAERSRVQRICRD